MSHLYMSLSVLQKVGVIHKIFLNFVVTMKELIQVKCYNSDYFYHVGFLDPHAVSLALLENYGEAG